MSMLKDEVSVLKSVMVQLDSETAVLVSLQYHVEPGENGKTDRSKSKYRWLARVFKLADLKSKIEWCYRDENRLNRFKWPDDPDPWYICAGGDSENRRIGDWLATKLKKIQTWENGLKTLDGWETKTKKRQAGYNASAKYDTDDYLDPAGNKVSLKDKDELLKHVGQNLYKTRLMKSKLPK